MNVSAARKTRVCAPNQRPIERADKSYGGLFDRIHLFSGERALGRDVDGSQTLLPPLGYEICSSLRGLRTPHRCEQKYAPEL